jgi:hypothetical protein
MNHAEAIRIKATEQYLLEEMPADVRDAFEDHFMGCAECAADVRTSAVFMGSVKEALGPELVPAVSRPAAEPPRGGWLAVLLRPAIAAPVMAVLIGLLGYQSLVTIPRMKFALATAQAPSSVASFSLLSASSRGEASLPVAAKRNQPFTLYVDVPPQPSFPLYTLDVESANGAFAFSLPVTAEEAKNSVQVLVPKDRLAAGDYVMVIRGAASSTDAQGTEVGRARFSLTYID